MAGLVVLLLVQACVRGVSVCVDEPAVDTVCSTRKTQSVEGAKSLCDKNPGSCVWVYGKCLDKPAAGKPCHFLVDLGEHLKAPCLEQNSCLWIHGNCVAVSTVCKSNEAHGEEQRKQTCDVTKVNNGDGEQTCVWVPELTAYAPPKKAQTSTSPPSPPTTTTPPAGEDESSDDTASIAAIAHVEVATVVTWMISIFGRSTCI